MNDNNYFESPTGYNVDTQNNSTEPTLWDFIRVGIEEIPIIGFVFTLFELIIAAIIGVFKHIIKRK